MIYGYIAIYLLSLVLKRTFVAYTGIKAHRYVGYIIELKCALVVQSQVSYRVRVELGNSGK